MLIFHNFSNSKTIKKRIQNVDNLCFNQVGVTCKKVHKIKTYLYKFISSQYLKVNIIWKCVTIKSVSFFIWKLKKLSFKFNSSMYRQWRGKYIYNKKKKKSKNSEEFKNCGMSIAVLQWSIHKSLKELTKSLKKTCIFSCLKHVSVYVCYCAVLFSIWMFFYWKV